MSRKVLDALVVGAGSVGAVTALGLSRAGLSVACVEAREPTEFVVGGPVDLRVYALSPATRQILQALDVWPQIAIARLGRYERMRVWNDAGSLNFDAAEMGQAELGHIVEGTLLNDRLWQALATDTTIERYCPDQVADIHWGEDLVTVVLESGRRLRTRLLIAADGSRSSLRSRVGLNQRVHDYQQSALVTHVRCEQPHGETAFQRFSAEGPVALLPLADGRSSVVWSQPHAQAQRRIELSDQEFCEELSSATGDCLGAVLECDRRAAFPLRMALSERYIAQRFAMVGDAAHSVHPLAGQGMNLGMLDAACLIDHLAKALKRGADPGARSILRRYERERISENTLAALSFDNLNRLFSRRHGALGQIAGVGMNAIDKLAPLKRWLIGHASGLDSLPVVGSGSAAGR